MCTKYKKQRKNKKFKETGDSQYIYQNELDKACFQHDMASGDFENLTKRIALIKSCVTKHLILLKVLNNYLKSYTSQLLKKLKKRKVHSPFIDNILVADFAKMQLIRKFNKMICFLLYYVSDIFRKYTWVIPLKDKNGVTKSFG